MLTQSDHLPEENAKRPDVTVCRENAISDRLECHPLERKSSAGQLEVLIAGVDHPGQSKVADLDDLVVAEKYVSGGKVTVDVMAIS